MPQDNDLSMDLENQNNPNRTISIIEQKSVQLNDQSQSIKQQISQSSQSQIEPDKNEKPKQKKILIISQDSKGDTIEIQQVYLRLNEGRLQRLNTINASNNRTKHNSSTNSANSTQNSNKPESSMILNQLDLSNVWQLPQQAMIMQLARLYITKQDQYKKQHQRQKQSKQLVEANSNNVNNNRVQNNTAILQSSIKMSQQAQFLNEYNSKINDDIFQINFYFTPEILKLFKTIFPQNSNGLFYKIRQKILTIKPDSSLQYFLPQSSFKNHNKIQNQLFSLNLSGKADHIQKILTIDFKQFSQIIQQLILTDCNLNVNFNSLINNIKCLKELKSLSLDHNNLGIQNLNFFVQNSQHFQHLSILNLQNNNLNDEAFIYFLQNWKGEQFIKLIVFDQNNVSEKGLNEFIEIKRTKFKNLKNLDLKNNNIVRLQQSFFQKIQQLKFNQSGQQVELYIDMSYNKIDVQTTTLVLNYLLNDQVKSKISFLITPQIITLNNKKLFQKFMKQYQHNCYMFYKLNTLLLQNFKLDDQCCSLLFQNMNRYQNVQNIKIDVNENDQILCSRIIQFLQQYSQYRQNKRQIRLYLQFYRLSQKTINYIKDLYQLRPQINLTIVYKQQLNEIHQKRQNFVQFKQKFSKLVQNLILYNFKQKQTSNQVFYVLKYMKEMLNSEQLKNKINDSDQQFIQRLIQRVIKYQVEYQFFSKYYKPLLAKLKQFLLERYQYFNHSYKRDKLNQLKKQLHQKDKNMINKFVKQLLKVKYQCKSQSSVLIPKQNNKPNDY